MLTKDKLIFDPADIADSDQVGAYIVGAGGAVATTATVGGSEALDVNLVQSVGLVVSATNLDIRDLSHSQDSVKVGDGTDFLAVNADGSINSVVTATDLDIRDLTHVSDSVKVGDGVDLLAVNADGSINVNLTDDSIADDAADSGNPFKVGGRAYATASALAAVSAGDRVNLAMDLFRRVLVNDAPNVGINNPAVITVGTSEVAIPAAPLAGRKKLIVQNTSANDVFVGATGVSTAKGIKVSKGATLELDAGQALAFYAIAAGAGNDVRIMELA